jgi:hypothetical protein
MIARVICVTVFLLASAYAAQVNVRAASAGFGIGGVDPRHEQQPTSPAWLRFTECCQETKVFAWEEVETMAWTNAEFLKGIAP